MTNRQTVNPPSANSHGKEHVAVTGPAKNDNLSEALPIQSPPVESPRNVNTPAPRQAPAPPKSTNDLLARAQVVDLKRAPDGADFRAPGEGDASKELFKVAASRLGETRLRVVLPANSKRGVYDVSIRDRAFLNEIVSAKGKSLDGRNLFVSINLQGLKTDEYVLRITRRDPKAGDSEYVGDYGLLVRIRYQRDNSPRNP